MKDPKILAFMQNPWFEPGTRPEITDKYRTDQEFHRRLLARTMSGGRLLQAFGPDMFGKIWWDNVAPAAAFEAAGKTDVDAQHVERVINEVRPDLIITFGILAEEAVDNSILATDIDYMCCHHPNARHHTVSELMNFAIDVQQWVERWRLK
jgi:hypothetical protein